MFSTRNKTSSNKVSECLQEGSGNVASPSNGEKDHQVIQKMCFQKDYEDLDWKSQKEETLESSSDLPYRFPS